MPIDDVLGEGALMSPAKSLGCRSGFTLLEIIVALAILALASLGLFSMLVTGSSENMAQRQKLLAMNAARSQVETMMNETFSNVFARYNSNAADDPGGAGTAPGPNFAVDVLEPVQGDADGLEGEIIFPVNAGGNLDETLTTKDATLMEMPRDLNNDGDAADTNVSATYQVLPVLVRLRYRGPYGPVTTEYMTKLFSLKQ